MIRRLVTRWLTAPRLRGVGERGSADVGHMIANGPVGGREGLGLWLHPLTTQGPRTTQAWRDPQIHDSVVRRSAWARPSWAARWR
jgi:hypothetical protein